MYHRTIFRVRDKQILSIENEELHNFFHISTPLALFSMHCYKYILYFFVEDSDGMKNYGQLWFLYDMSNAKLMHNGATRLVRV